MKKIFFLLIFSFVSFFAFCQETKEPYLVQSYTFEHQTAYLSLQEHIEDDITYNLLGELRYNAADEEIPTKVIVRKIFFKNKEKAIEEAGKILEEYTDTGILGFSAFLSQLNEETKNGEWQYEIDTFNLEGVPNALIRYKFIKVVE